MAIQVQGGRKASGSLKIQGSKNAVLPLMAATILTSGTFAIENCPDISDVYAMKEVMESLGSDISFENGLLQISTSDIKCVQICQQKVKDIRASVLLMGACLARFGRVVIAYPGGCSIGERPIDFHLQAFRAMGVIVEEQEERLLCYCEKALEGAEIALPFPSVGATENALLAACMAKGITKIDNAAKEPEVIELVQFLRAMGAKIKGEGTSCICVEGGSGLHPVSWRLSEDRIAFLTYAMMVAGCNGDVEFQMTPQYLSKELWVLQQLGCHCEVRSNSIRVQKNGSIRPLSFIRTGPYPEYPTDGQSLLLAVVSKAAGISNIEENVFENRFRVIQQLKQMGANIDFVSNRARVTGVTKLHGATVTAPDLRSGAALLIAATMAEGTSFIQDEKYIFRGYEAVADNMRKLGLEAYVTI